MIETTRSRVNKHKQAARAEEVPLRQTHPHTVTPKAALLAHKKYKVGHEGFVILPRKKERPVTPRVINIRQ